MIFRYKQTLHHNIYIITIIIIIITGSNTGWRQQCVSCDCAQIYKHKMLSNIHVSQLQKYTFIQLQLYKHLVLQTAERFQIFAAVKL